MARRNPWLVVGGGVLGLLGVLIAGVAGYWRYANQLPVYPAPIVVMPVPNAYDDYVAAGQLCKAAGGATIPTAPAPPKPRPAPPGYGAPPGYSGGPAPPVYPGGPYTPPPPGAAPAAPFSASGRPLQAYEPGAPLAQVRAVVQRNRPALARLRQGFRKQYRCPPVVSYTQLFPELAQYRELARVLVSEGKLAEREGRLADAAHSYLDCLHLGVDVPRGGPLIHGLVGLAIQYIGLRPLQQVAARLDGPTAAAAAREMARLDAHAPGAAEVLTHEKEGMTTSLLEIFRQPGGWRQFTGTLSANSSGAPTGEELMMSLKLAFIPKRVILDNIRGYMDALIADSRQPYYVRTSPPPLPGDPLSQIELPVFNGVRLKWAQRDAQWQITELRLATRAYEQAHGAPQPSLDALAPVYLPAVPQDPFAPKPMVYRRQASGGLIYSRGPDGKDDGGKDLGVNAAPGMKGDIVSMKGSRSR